MAVTIIKSIGTAVGRDYTTLAAWEAGEQGDLTVLNEMHIGEMYSDSVFTAGVTISGSFTSATQHMHIRPAAGHEHLGVPGAGVVINFNGLNIINIQDSFTIVEGIEVDGGAVHSSGNKSAISAAGANCVARSIIAHGLYASRNFDIAKAFEARNSGGVEIYNNLIYDIKKPVATASTADTIGIKASFNNSKIYNNTIIDVANPLSTPDGSAGLNSGTSNGIILLNNIVMDTGGVDFFSGGFAGISSNNMDSDGTAFGTSNQQNKISSNQFVNLALNDYNLKAGSSAINNGIPVAAVTVDISGNIRDLSTPDIGCFEFQGGGPAINVGMLINAGLLNAGKLRGNII